MASSLVNADGRIPRLARNERLAGLIGFSWGFAEGLVFFIVPDVYISFATLFSPRAGIVAWFSSIAGSVLAVAVIFVLTAMFGVDYLGFLPSIPGISSGLVERVAERLAEAGLPYTASFIFTGVPLKLYVGLALSLGVSLGSVLLWTVFARIVRIAPTVAATAVLRRLFSRVIDARPVVWTALLLFFWAAFYVFYFIRMGRI